MDNKTIVLGVFNILGEEDFRTLLDTVGDECPEDIGIRETTECVYVDESSNCIECWIKALGNYTENKK